LLAGCAPLHSDRTQELESLAAARQRVERDAEIMRSAQLERVDQLEREVARLRADLRQAEESMVAIESGLRGIHTRADSVSALAEVRIAVDRARRGAPWRKREILEAQAKLEEAERQLQEGHSGSAVFFASRAQRIADNLDEEARHVEASKAARFVHAHRLNLRAGPSTAEPVIGVLERATPVFLERDQDSWMLVRTLSGQVGWVHASMLHER
jgi:hypothetical protein